MNLRSESEPSSSPTRNRSRRLTLIVLLFVVGTIVVAYATACFVSEHDLSPIVRPFCTRETRRAIDTLRSEGLQVYYLRLHYRRNGWMVVSRHDSSMDDTKLLGLAPALRVLEPTIVFLTHNRIGDSGVACLGGIRSIEFLDLGWTQLGDASSKTLATLPFLKELYLNDTAITDVGLGDLKNLKNLQLLAVGKTRVTQEGIEAFGRAAPSIDVDNSGRGWPR